MIVGGRHWKALVEASEVRIVRRREDRKRIVLQLIRGYDGWKWLEFSFVSCCD